MARRQADVFTQRRMGIGRWVLLLFLLLLAGCGVYVAMDNGSAVVLSQKVLVGNLPEALEGFTVLHISDLNGKRFGPKQKQLEAVLRGKKYNVVCLTGNMVGESGDLYPLYELLSILDPTKPVFFIAGDSDPVVSKTQGPSLIDDWIGGLEARGATFLDMPASMSVGKSKVWFSDASQLSLDLNVAKAAYQAANTSESTRQLDIIEQTIALRKEMREEDLHVVLSPIPVKRQTMQSMQSVNDKDISAYLRTVDLIVSGGTAGGQWRIPFIGPVWMDGWFPPLSAVQGYHYAGSFFQYISGGLHVLQKSPLPGFRLFNTPEMTLITFTSYMDDNVLPDD